MNCSCKDMVKKLKKENVNFDVSCPKCGAVYVEHKIKFPRLVEMSEFLQGRFISSNKSVEDLWRESYNNGGWVETTYQEWLDMSDCGKGRMELAERVWDELTDEERRQFLSNNLIRLTEYVREIQSILK